VTENWRDRRDSYLSVLVEMRHTDLGCETCDSLGPGGVFHRCLRRLGSWDDVILLCDPCASALQGAGKLVREIDRAGRRARPAMLAPRAGSTRFGPPP